MVGEWIGEQNDAIVDDYFAMLACDAADEPYSKAEHNRRLQAATGRQRGSIEYKHQNISVVLKGLGEDWIPGYKPAFNYQLSLVDAMVRWLVQHASWLERSAAPGASRLSSGVAEDPQLWIGPLPTHSNRPPPDELDQMMALAVRYGVADRDARNRALGRAGEERLLEHERAALTNSGRADLARRVRWVAAEDGDGAGYDIASSQSDGNSRLIEVKTTNGWERTPFHISRNECAVADRHRDEWCLVRLWNFARAPKAFELRPPLAAYVTLASGIAPTLFAAIVLLTMPRKRRLEKGAANGLGVFRLGPVPVTGAGRDA